MLDDALARAMPLAGFGGGLMIGLAAALMLLGLGRIAGVAIAPLPAGIFVLAMLAGMLIHRLVVRPGRPGPTAIAMGSR